MLCGNSSCQLIEHLHHKLAAEAAAVEASEQKPGLSCAIISGRQKREQHLSFILFLLLLLLSLARFEMSTNLTIPQRLTTPCRPTTQNLNYIVAVVTIPIKSEGRGEISYIKSWL